MAKRDIQQISDFDLGRSLAPNVYIAPPDVGCYTSRMGNKLNREVDLPKSSTGSLWSLSLTCSLGMMLTMFTAQALMSVPVPSKVNAASVHARDSYTPPASSAYVPYTEEAKNSDELPNQLSKEDIKSVMQPVARRAKLACGDLAKPKEKIKISIKVASHGRVLSAKERVPASAATACVKKVITTSAVFRSTQTGRSFTYPFVLWK